MWKRCLWQLLTTSTTARGGRAAVAVVTLVGIAPFGACPDYSCPTDSALRLGLSANPIGKAGRNKPRVPAKAAAMSEPTAGSVQYATSGTGLISKVLGIARDMAPKRIAAPTTSQKSMRSSVSADRARAR